MNKRLEKLLSSVRTWSDAAQDEAVRALEEVGRRHSGDDLAVIREKITRSIYDPQPDIDAANVFAEIEKEFENSKKNGGNAA